MSAVNDVIRRQLYSDVPLVNQVAEYIISAGGKRLRPVLVLLIANAYGYQGKNHHDLAATIEFIHTATLLHDDVLMSRRCAVVARPPMPCLVTRHPCLSVTSCIHAHSR
jgi:geranylgeranyl pyrophosphate synthase